jgi:outer membrane protein TolC
MAAMQSKVAFQEYRKQSMLVLSSAEVTYWRLFLLQEQLQFLEQSVTTAQTILNDSKVRLDAGQSSELDVMEAEAGLALRRSLLAEVRQKLREASNEMASLFSERLNPKQAPVHALTKPKIQDRLPDPSKVYATAYQLNPDYSMQIEKATREGIALDYLRNQRLPELNLRGSYGLSGLSDNPGGSWDDLATGDWPAWMVGLELRVPVGGGTKARAEYAAARLREQETLLGLRAIETQMLNSLDSALKRIDETRVTATNYQAQVALREAVLSAALSRLEVGKIESRRVLEIEADLLETKSAEVEAMVNNRKAVVDLYFLDGSLLSRWNLDFSQTDLQQSTAAFVRPGGMSREQYAEMIRQAQQLQAAGGTGPWPRERETLNRQRSETQKKLQQLDRVDWDPSD